MIKFIDFETANHDGAVYQLGIVSEEGIISEKFDVQAEWSWFHKMFNFAKRGLNFKSYNDKQKKLNTFEEYIKNNPSLFEGELFAWGAGLERKCLRKYGIDKNVTCVMELAKSKIVCDSYSLSSVALTLGIEVNDGLLHDAYYDAFLTKEIYYRLQEEQPVVKQRKKIKAKSLKEAKSYFDENAISEIKGLKIAVTGEVAGYTRNELFARISELGGLPRSSVSRVTDILVTSNANSDSSKMMLAKEYNIKIISAVDFRAMIEKE